MVQHAAVTLLRDDDGVREEQREGDDYLVKFGGAESLVGV